MNYVDSTGHNYQYNNCDNPLNPVVEVTSKTCCDDYPMYMNQGLAEGLAITAMGCVEFAYTGNPTAWRVENEQDR